MRKNKENKNEKSAEEQTRRWFEPPCSSHLMARLSFSYVMLLFLFFCPQSCATASDLRNLKTPSVRSSHFISPLFFSGLIRMSRMNSHRWVPRGAVARRVWRLGFVLCTH